MSRLYVLMKGGVKCSSACPFYEASGTVHDTRGVPMKGHCLAVTEDVVVNCDKYNPHRIRYVDIPEEKVASIERVLKTKFKRIRKLYPRMHKEIHPVGWTPKAKKSAGSDPA